MREGDTMNTNSNHNSKDVLTLTGEIVTTYLGHNQMASSEVPGLIERVHAQLATFAGNASPRAPLSVEVSETNAILKPAVPINESITPEFIICLEDGQKFQMMKRHLMTSYNMTPEQYRQKWGLPVDYPMVAPNYADERRAFAKKIGLGTPKIPTTKKRAKPGPKPKVKTVVKH